jgi:hypothetical protein
VTLISIGWGRLGAMRIGRRSYRIIFVLGTIIALIAKDFSVPLAGVAVLGLFDRLVAMPLLRGRDATGLSA